MTCSAALERTTTCCSTVLVRHEAAAERRGGSAARAHARPAQIELYSHVTVFNTFSETLKQQGWRCAPPPAAARPPLTCSPRSMCVVYLLDSQFIIDAPKYISGCLARAPAGCVRCHALTQHAQAALSSMLQMELPHVNVLSKVDLLREKKATLEE